MEPLTASIYLRELGTDRWVYCAIACTRGTTRLLVEVDLVIPPTPFVHFDHVSEGYASR